MTSGGFVPVAAKAVQIGDFPQRRLRAVAASVCRSAAANGVPARLMLPVIMPAAEREVLLGPDDLRPDLKARCCESAHHLSGMNTGMPHIGNIAAEQLIRRGPIGLI